MMKKMDWVRKQIKEAFDDEEDWNAPFVSILLEQVEAAGEGLTRSQFKNIFESLCPEEIAEHTIYMILDTQLSYAADYSEAWITTPVVENFPEIKFKAFYGDMSLSESFVKLGGEPDWIQNESFPVCEECDRNMVLFAQFRSLPAVDAAPELAAYTFGDMGNLYVFECPGCHTYKTQEECY